MKLNSTDEGQRWFKQAEYELNAAQTLTNNGLHAAACFFAHQSAEKFLKALLYFLGERRVIGHSINQLCDQCANYCNQFTHLKNQVKQLDLYYIPTRYPNGLPGGIPAEMYDETDVDSALEMVIAVQQAVIEAAPHKCELKHINN